MLFVAFRGVGLYSRLIQWWTRGEYSHIGILADFQDMVLIEAWHFDDGWRWGYNGIGNREEGTVWEIWHLPMDEAESKFCMDFYQQLADRKAGYDWKGILGFVLHKPYDDASKYFCSEGAIAPIVQWRGWKKVKPWRVSPTRFIEIVEAAGGQIIEKGVL